MPWVFGGGGRDTESLVLDPGATVGAAVDLGDSTGILRLASLVIPPAQKVPTWTSQGDGDGTLLVRSPFYANRECSMQVRVNATDGDSAMAAIGTLESKLQEADRLDGGLPVLWTPAGATTGLKLYVLLAQITDMPVTVEDGWLAHKPILTVQFSCKPFLYGDEITGSSTTSTSPIITLEASDVAGDVPAEARLVVTDASTHAARRFVEWGVEQHYYDHASPAPLLIDSASMVTTGFAGTALTHSGAYGGTTIASTLLSQPVAVCGLGNQPHIGTYRVKARIYSPSPDQYWRLSWRTGDSDYAANDWTPPVDDNAFSEIDLGLIDVSPVLEGDQAWTGQIEAYSNTPGGETGEIDNLMLFPALEGYGQIAAAYSYRPGVIVSYDDFSGGTAGDLLNGHVAPMGGTWSTSGATFDFAIHHAANSAARTTAFDSGYRYAVLGSARTDTEVTAVIGTDANAGPDTIISMALIARWTDANNHVRLVFDINTGFVRLTLETVVAGVVSNRAHSTQFRFVPGDMLVGYQLRLIAYASGSLIGQLLFQDTTVTTIFGHSGDVATGGTLESGLVGFADHTDVADVERFYWNFLVSTPALESLVINAGKTLEIRSNATLRASADGTTYGEIASRGSRLFIPPAGDASRTSRVAVRATRADLTTMADTSVTDGDNLKAQLFHTPRYLAVPR